jgi:hypothetical protein
LENAALYSPIALLVAFSAMLAFALQSPPAKSTPAPQPPDARFPLNFERHTGDLDEMVKRGSIRALVVYSRSGFFYVNGKPEGIYYHALQYFAAVPQSEVANPATCAGHFYSGAARPTGSCPQGRCG